MTAGISSNGNKDVLASGDPAATTLLSSVATVGGKAAGLQILPAAWCPPYVVLPTYHFIDWRRLTIDERRGHELKLAALIYVAREAWRDNWPRGLIIRSSSTNEALSERGQNLSLHLAADTDVPGFAAAIKQIYEQYPGPPNETIAIIIQPLVPNGWVGHFSNERRVSKTVNQWMWEWHHPGPDGGRFNSQRTAIPDLRKPLVAKNVRELHRTMQGVGRWAAALARGPCHFEMAWSPGTLWLLQLDFEDEAPDTGVDPVAMLFADGLRPPHLGDQRWALRRLDLNSGSTGWRKLDNVRQFASVRKDPFPPLFYIEGDRFSKALPAEIEAEVLAVTDGRGVCRTDCRAHGIERENLPRTDSAGPSQILAFMQDKLSHLVGRGAAPHEICFIIHRFIPAVAGAWARAAPGNRIVQVDALWGVPDGLQFLPHDRFEYDVQRGMLEAERLRYKPAFIQEAADGVWSRVPVLRRLGRSRSISRSDIAEIAGHTQAIVEAAGKPLNIMWFCGIPEVAGVGKNLPWFSMPPSEADTDAQRSHHISSRSLRIHIRTFDDLARAEETATRRGVLSLDPETDLIRNHVFLERIKVLALKYQLAVEIAGSVLAHAYYQLEKSGVSVFPADEPRRGRIRGKQIFAKLVRDEIPSHIEQQGEYVTLAHLQPSDTRTALIAKIFEEALELRAAVSPDEVTMELADLLEILRALAATTGVQWEDVIRVTDDKRDLRGGFSKGLVLLTTGWQPVKPSRRPSLRSVSLNDLGYITEFDDGKELNFPLILSRTSRPVVRLPDGTNVRLSISTAGVRIRLEEAIKENSLQLNFAFANPSDII